MKINKKALLSIGLISSMAIGSPNFAQNQKNNIQKELVQGLNQNNSEHNTIINMNFEDILRINGKEKGLEIIRKHFLIEINNYRKLESRPELKQDTTLDKAAQKFAEYASPYDKLGHYFDDKGMEDMGVSLDGYRAIGENVSYRLTNIQKVVSAWYYKSPEHKKTMLGLHISKHTGEIIAYEVLGIGVDKGFVVAEFANVIK